MTYDLEVEGPHHNFVANGIVTHNSVNELSTRYSVAIDAKQKTDPSAWRTQAQGNRQGSGDPVDGETGGRLSEAEAVLHAHAQRVYEERLAAGIAREQARKDLPLSTYTEAYWKIDLHNLLHFLALRMDAHAQEEIRAYAGVIGNEIVRAWCPITWEAFLDYRMGQMTLSRIEQAILRGVASSDPAGAVEAAEAAGWLGRREDGTLQAHRERLEFEEKLRALGLPIPWR